MTIKKFRDPRVGETPEGATRRLTNIRPREVSLVDAAANGREFLIVKRKDAMKKKEQELFKSGASSNPPANESTTEGAGGDGKTEETPVTRQVEKHFVAMVEKDLEGVSVAKALASTQHEMFLAMSHALVQMAASMDMIRADILAFANSDGSTHFMGQPVEQLSPDIRKSIEGFEDGLTDSVFKSLVELVEKKGRKMKKSRLEQFKSLVEGLSDLAKELEGSEQDSANDGGSSVKKDQQGSNETQTKTEDTATNKSAEAQTTEGGEGKTTDQQSSEGDTVTKGADDLAKVVEAAVAKAVKPLQERIEKLEAEPAAPASEGTDSTEDNATTVNKSWKERSGKERWGGVLGTAQG